MLQVTFCTEEPWARSAAGAEWPQAMVPIKGHTRRFCQVVLCLQVLSQPSSIHHQLCQSSIPRGRAEEDTRLPLSNACRTHTAGSASAPFHSA